MFEKFLLVIFLVVERAVVSLGNPMFSTEIFAAAAGKRNKSQLVATRLMLAPLGWLLVLLLRFHCSTLRRGGETDSTFSPASARCRFGLTLQVLHGGIGFKV